MNGVNKMAKNIFGKTRDINKPYAEYLVGNIFYRIVSSIKNFFTN